MGIYDREYSQPEGGFSLGGERMMVTNIILLTVGVYIAQLIVDSPLTNFLALDSNLFSTETLQRPWRILTLVTYGFVHARSDLLHILFNMFVLWFFGRDVELHYGRRKFLAIYLTTIVFAGLVWAISEQFAGQQFSQVVGASGGVVGIMLLFVLHWPHRIIYIWGIIPAPVWIIALIYLIGDVMGAVNRSGNVAYTAHLAGAAYAWVFYKTGWSFDSLTPSRLPSWKSLRKPKLKLHDPEDFEDTMSQEVDEILKKIQEQGQDSLTAKERRTLERASRRYQQKHR